MPRIVGFTDLRRRELLAPLEAVDYDGTVVAVDPDQSLTERATEQLSSGRRACRAVDPDVLLVYNGSGVLGLLSILLGWWYGVPVLVRVNGDVFRQHREKVAEYRERGAYGRAVLYVAQASLTRLTFDRADAFLVVSRELKRIVCEETGCPASRVAVVHNPAPDVRPADDESPPAVLEAADHERLLLTVTNLNFHGKYAGTRDAVDDLWPSLPEDTGWIIAGDGLYRDALESHVEETVDDPAVRDRIYTPGFVEAVEHLYAGADVFVYVSDIDGYPNAVLEAQAAGLPVVANEAHGMVEQIDDRRTGLLVDPSRDGAVAEAVGRLLAEPAVRERLGSAARRDVQRHNAPRRIGTELLDAIDDVLDGAARVDRPQRAVATDT